MTASEFSGLLKGYMKEKFGIDKVDWSIETTTPKDPKAGYTDANYQSGYTLCVINRVTKSVIMKSKEIKNHHKSSWSDYAYGTFLATLTNVEQLDQ